jgi:hypothetical protein
MVAIVDHWIFAAQPIALPGSLTDARAMKRPRGL